MTSHVSKHHNVGKSPEKIDESKLEAAAQGLAAIDPSWMEALIYLERLRLMDMQPAQKPDDRKAKKSKTLRKEIDKIRRSRGAI